MAGHDQAGGRPRHEMTPEDHSAFVVSWWIVRKTRLPATTQTTPRRRHTISVTSSHAPDTCPSGRTLRYLRRISPRRGHTTGGVGDGSGHEAGETHTGDGGAACRWRLE